MVQVVAPEIPAPPTPDIPFMMTPGMGIIIILGMAAAVVILWPLVRAIARRIEGKGRTDPTVLDEVDHLRSRVTEVEGLQGRIAELEERVDFAERLLAQKRQPEQLER